MFTGSAVLLLVVFLRTKSQACAFRCLLRVRLGISLLLLRLLGFDVVEVVDPVLRVSRQLLLVFVCERYALDALDRLALEKHALASYGPDDAGQCDEQAGGPRGPRGAGRAPREAAEAAGK